METEQAAEEPTAIATESEVAAKSAEQEETVAEEPAAEKEEEIEASMESVGCPVLEVEDGCGLVCYCMNFDLGEELLVGVVDVVELLSNLGMASLSKV
ncbi:hypothetical protein Droror1_Dr00020426 [Drosera rotundifolia]